MQLITLLKNRTLENNKNQHEDNESVEHSDSTPLSKGSENDEIIRPVFETFSSNQSPDPK